MGHDEVVSGERGSVALQSADSAQVKECLLVLLCNLLMGSETERERERENSILARFIHTRARIPTCFETVPAKDKSSFLPVRRRSPLAVALRALRSPKRSEKRRQAMLIVRRRLRRLGNAHGIVKHARAFWTSWSVNLLRE